MEISVFRKGEWIVYTIPKELPSGWQSNHSYQAASLYASAKIQGYPPLVSASIAELYIFKQLFEGILYDAKFESLLQTVLNHVEKA